MINVKIYDQFLQRLIIAALFFSDKCKFRATVAREFGKYLPKCTEEDACTFSLQSYSPCPTRQKTFDRARQPGTRKGKGKA